MSEDRPNARRRGMRLQFSLRFLLLAFTAFAIGFPIWYRWPYEETVEDPAAFVKRITTWQRQWGGERVKHGLERFIVDGQTVGSVVYRNGRRHGPYEGGGVRGQYVDDMKDGVWTEPFRTSTWRLGKLDGPMEFRLPAQRPHPAARVSTNEGRTIQLVFADGRLTHFDGKPVASGSVSAANRLFDLQYNNLVDDRTANELGKLTNVDFVEVPLKDCLLYLSELHGLPIMLDPKLRSSSDRPITADYQGIDLCSLLLLLTAPHELGCDYRYGCLWITAADDCIDWQDPTGIEKIKPPSGSALARAWNEPFGVDFYTPPPLKLTLDSIEEKMGVSIDAGGVLVGTTQTTDRTGSRTMATTPLGTIRGRPLRHVIGHLLYFWNCRCELEGDKLVILPQEKK